MCRHYASASFCSNCTLALETIGFIANRQQRQLEACPSTRDIRDHQQPDRSDILERRSVCAKRYFHAIASSTAASVDFDCFDIGPYASAILRFTIRFPPSYPELPPLVVFSTDIFHPLIVPLTTYTFTTGSSSEAPVSATDEERLPPGGFSLRHGFPHWFGRAQRTASSSAISSRQVSGSSPAHEGRQQSAGESGEDEKEESDGQSRPPSSEKQAPRVSPAPAFAPYHQTQRTVPVVELLNYIRSTFDDETVLDSLPFDAAGNQGAWHAWRAHRNPRSSRRDAGISRTSTPDSQAKKSTPQTRPPGEWNWEGVWAKRVRSGIEASQSDAMLFGHSLRSDDPVCSQISVRKRSPADNNRFDSFPSTRPA